MKIINRNILGTLIVMIFSLNLFAFEHKDINSFKQLKDFNSISEFENYYDTYTKKCINNGYGGRESIPCFITYKLWDKELNIYYKKLMSKLNSNEKELLKKSQRTWLESRDSAITFNSTMLDNIYTESGTMYLLMRADDADSLISPIIKERALTLKRWYEYKNQ